MFQNKNNGLNEKRRCQTKKKCQTHSTYHSGIGQQIWTCYRQKHSEKYDFLKSNQNSSIRPEKNSTYSRSSVTVKTC